jgi:hypothetical protein
MQRKRVVVRVFIFRTALKLKPMKRDNLLFQYYAIEQTRSPKQIMELFRSTGIMLTSSKPRRIISVDPGNVISGFCMIENGQIAFAANLPNQFVIPKIAEFIQNAAYTVIIEDVRPYGTRLTEQLLDTAKFIGELCYRLIGLKVVPELIPRWEVKKWVFDTYNSEVLPYVKKKILAEHKKRVKKHNEDPKKKEEYSKPVPIPTWVCVDDRAVILAMKKMWHIPTPKPGKTNKYGINAHSWQALALASCFMSN